MIPVNRIKISVIAVNYAFCNDKSLSIYTIKFIELFINLVCMKKLQNKKAVVNDRVKLALLLNHA